MTLGGCAAWVPPQTAALLAQPPAGLPERVELEQTPFFAQTALHCGPAALATALVASGVEVTPDDLAPQVFLPSRQGSLQIEMLAAARRHRRLAVVLPRELQAVLREVAEGRPVVVLQNLGLALAPAWHYAVAVGYDLRGQEMVLRSGTVRRERLPLRTFEHTWARGGRWACVLCRPEELPSTAEEAEVAQAAVAFERVAPPGSALRAYDTALKRWPANLTLAMGRGNSLYAAGRKREALDAFAQAARAHASAAAWINLGEVALELGQPARALEAAEAALRLRSGFSEQAQDLQRRAALSAPASAAGTPAGSLR